MSNHLLGEVVGKVFQSQQKIKRINTDLKAKAAESLFDKLTISLKFNYI